MRSPCRPGLHEGYMHSAIDYVRLAEEANGAIPRNVDPFYVWGAAFGSWDHMRPDLRIANLETAITHCEAYVRKGINYRMSPENADCLAAAGIDCCGLANNHVLDWERAGLIDTLATLDRLGVKSAGAGLDIDRAKRPAAFEVGAKGRVLVFALGSTSSGIPKDWSARRSAPGVWLASELSEAGAMKIAEHIANYRRPDDLVVVSIHWGPNWGYEISAEQRQFAHALIDSANVAVVHGHSSHHAKGIELYRGRLILYGCGDFLNDYEGIRGYEEYRADIALMYFADIEAKSSRLAGLTVIPLQIRKLKLVRPSPSDCAWVGETLDRESRSFGLRASFEAQDRIGMVEL